MNLPSSQLDEIRRKKVLISVSRGKVGSEKRLDGRIGKQTSHWFNKHRERKNPSNTTAEQQTQIRFNTRCSSSQHQSLGNLGRIMERNLIGILSKRESERTFFLVDETLPGERKDVKLTVLLFAYCEEKHELKTAYYRSRIHSCRRTKSMRHGESAKGGKGCRLVTRHCRMQLARDSLGFRPPDLARLEFCDSFHTSGLAHAIVFLA